MHGMKFQNIRLLISVALLPTLLIVSICNSAAQNAETWPVKPIRIVVPYPPGGGAEILARLAATHMSNTFGQPVIVENRGGAGSMIGIEYVMKTPADGYTVLIATTAFVINPTLYKKVNYEPLRDFAAVSLGISFPYLLVVHPSLPAKNVREMIALAKSQPGKMSFASDNARGLAGMLGEMLNVFGGIDVVHVPYNGTQPAMQDTVGDEAPALDLSCRRSTKANAAPPGSTHHPPSIFLAGGARGGVPLAQPLSLLSAAEQRDSDAQPSEVLRQAQDDRTGHLSPQRKRL